MEHVDRVGTLLGLRAQLFLDQALAKTQVPNARRMAVIDRAQWARGADEGAA